jgi:predicted transcriptional regulator of viral defense system
MKRIGLTTEELERLETALIEYGNVVTFDQLNGLFNEDRAYLRKRISRLVHEGWLKRVKNGTYVLSDLSTRGRLSISHLSIINILVDEAYISFENALQYHGLYDQMLNNIIAVSLQRYKTTTIDGITYKFISTQEKYFFGWATYDIDGQAVKIAQAEKALIDLIQFHRNRYSTDLVIEKLLTYQNDLDHQALIEFALQSNLTTQRILGFVMDIAKLDSSHLDKVVSNRKSVSSITSSKNNYYSNKWKLYYDSYFSRYTQK